MRIKILPKPIVILFFASGLITITLALIPFSALTVPEWQIQVINTVGNPVSKIKVTQTWKHSSFESAASFNEDIRYTDALGEVIFPERRIQATALQQFWSLIKETIDFSPHSSYGPSSNVFVEGPNEGSLWYKGGQLPGNTIVAK